MKAFTHALALLTTLLFLSTVSAADSTNKYNETASKMTAPERPKQAIGISLGWVVANGLSYRRYYGDQFVQATFAGAVNKDKDSEYIDFSLSYGSYLNPLNFSSTDFPVGFKFITGLELERDSNRQDDLVSQEPNKSIDELHIGAGFGLDFGSPGKKGLIYGIDLIYTASFRNLSELEFVRLGLLPSVNVQFNL